ncbi:MULTISPECIES: GNAT family N-acetyltransferase [Microbacterium]|uniref:GNAT family N-acetyltransferase n=1 Tax=Microbacterium TaxID=33882 RepID=UPI00278AE9CA|nr:MULTISPECIES: GNAT family N-acetyltransferase [Microbacterium]MDQ1082737.1 putative GNAT family acetyltransferase [Microbacterium sp. SORGH_AS_0344]MDQ1168493.1 putative GNAT family acetyltransferase [Microbacterium proteolyticum]
MADELTVTRNDEARRYEIHVDGDLGGFMEFRPAGEGRVDLPHTELDPAFKGRGLGKALASEALSDLAQRGDSVIPSCPFVAHYLREHEVPGLEIEWPEESDAADSAAPGEPS